MNMNTLLKTSFFGMLCITIMGACFKIMHMQGADVLLIIGLISSVVFIATALYEINTSANIDAREKLMWTIGLMFMTGIAGIFYMVSRRRRMPRSA